MKKVIILFMLLSPAFVNASTCSKEIIDELKEKARQVSFDLIYDETISDSGEKDDYFKITAENMPDDFVIRLNYNSNMAYVLDKYNGVTIKGGVYTVKFMSTNCEGDTIETFTMMIPHYNEKNRDVWFDGTYVDQTVVTKEATTTSRTGYVLIGTALVALLLIVLISFFGIKKRRRIT